MGGGWFGCMLNKIRSTIAGAAYAKIAFDSVSNAFVAFSGDSYSIRAYGLRELSRQLQSTLTLSLTFANSSTICTGEPGRFSACVIPEHARAAMSPAFSSHSHRDSDGAASSSSTGTFSIVEMVAR